MPLPLLFIGIAALAGTAGAGATAKAGVDFSKAKNINNNSDARIVSVTQRLEELRHQCGASLEHLGQEKIYVLSNSMKAFVDTFSKIKNIDFTASEGLTELNKFHIDKKDFEELGELGNFVTSLAAGTIAGATGGTLAAFGAYSAAASFATASTGTAIGTLSGAAATNATLAFFGGGSLAAGGLGMAGGAAVLGGLVAGPALLVMGIITGAKAGKGLEQAKLNAAEADVICEQLETGAVQCVAIRRRTYMFHNLLARLDAFFLPLIYQMERVVADEGSDYSAYSPESKRIIAMAASTASSVKAVLDTPILNEDGSLTEESEAAVLQIEKKLEE